MHYRGISFVWLVIFGVASLVAQPLPPPVTGGIVNIEVTVGEETRAVQHDYQPPKAATILAESVQQVRYSRATQVFVPGVAGSVTSTFTFDPDYAANHSEVDKPIRGYNPWHQSLEHYSRIFLTTNWDAEGRKTFVLDATTYPGSATLQIEGRGRGGIFDSGGGPSALPIPMFHVADVTKATGKVAWFYWGTGHVYRHLPGINDYWADRQADGTTAVFHLDFFSEPAAELREYEPIGVVATAGTPGHGPTYETVSEALTEAGAFADLRDADWAFTGEFTPTIEPSAHYSFTSNVATASKLRYKLVVQPGLARTITWAETFTPDGAGEPSDIRFLSEDVTAVTTETQVHTLDPFARFGSQPGRYQVQAFEAESFEAGLTVDTNRDGKIIPAAGPMTGYVINNADLTSIAKPYGFMINVDDDDSDGTADNVDLQVNGPDDLADFFPVFLNIKQLLSTLPAGTKCILKHAEGAVNFVYTDLKQATAFTYLNNPETGFGPNFDQSAATATAQQITSIGVELSEEFVNRIRYQNQGVILVEFRTPTRQPLTLTIATGTGVFVITLPLQATLGELAVDANRDGEIKDDGSDATSVAQPYRFWINDDDDSGDDKRTSADDIPLPEGDNNRDSANGLVDGIRDLEDFFPVFLDLKLLLSALPPGANGVSYFLKQEEEAVGVVFTSYTRAQALDYLRGPPANLETGFGPTLSQKAGEATVTKVTAAGVEIFVLSSAFHSLIQNDGGVLLVEASKVTTKPLILEVRKGSDVLAEVKLELKFDQVETMFRYHNIRSLAHGTAIEAEKQGPNFGVSAPNDAPNDPFQGAANRKNVVFVHGYNVNGEAARGSAATVFKRFYWSGSKARFYAVLWRGDDGQGQGIAPAGATPDYHRNVGHAWQQGLYLRDFLLGLPGDTAIMAHSLGNMVTQVALTHERDPENAARLRLAPRPPVVRNYFAIDAAVPLEALRSSAITTASQALMRHSVWNGYDERLWSTHWHKLFAGAADARERLTWQNAFSGLDVGTNFYSSGEEVLADPDNDETPVIEPIVASGLHAWVAQEKIKGGNSIAADLFRSSTGGWGFNQEWYYEPTPTLSPGQFGYVAPRPRFSTEAHETDVPTSALPMEPFFRRFQASETGGFYPDYQGSRLRAPIGDVNADDEARKLVTFAKCLGEGIPALSFAQGSNSSTKFTDLGDNFDLNTDYSATTHIGFKNGWPASRGPNPEDKKWKHSDCLDVAYLFHFPLYDKMNNDGGLK